jgi:hypothetical protein
MVAWDLLGARVAPDGMVGNVFEGGLYLYPMESKDEVLRTSAGCIAATIASSRSTTRRRSSARHGIVFHHLWLRLVAFPEPPEVRDLRRRSAGVLPLGLRHRRARRDSAGSCGAAADPRGCRRTLAGWKPAATCARDRDLVDRRQARAVRDDLAGTSGRAGRAGSRHRRRVACATARPRSRPSSRP